MADEGQVAQEKRPASRERTSRPSSREPNGATGAVGAISSVPVLPGRLGAYDVQKAVGRGGYAIVFKGVRHEDGRVVAIKKVEVRAKCIHLGYHQGASANEQWCLQPAVHASQGNACQYPTAH